MKECFPNVSYSLCHYTLGQGRFINVIDYKNTSICIPCVDASEKRKMAVPVSMDLSEESATSKTSPTVSMIYGPAEAPRRACAVLQ